MEIFDGQMTATYWAAPECAGTASARLIKPKLKELKVVDNAW